MPFFMTQSLFSKLYRNDSLIWQLGFWVLFKMHENLLNLFLHFTDVVTDTDLSDVDEFCKDSHEKNCLKAVISFGWQKKLVDLDCVDTFL